MAGCKPLNEEWKNGENGHGHDPYLRDRGVRRGYRGAAGRAGIVNAKLWRMHSRLGGGKQKQSSQ